MIDKNQITEVSLTEEQEMYKENVLDHFKNPRNFGTLLDCKKEKGLNPLCGDQIELFVKLNNNKIEDIKFNGKGCAISQASASLLTEHIKNKDLNEVKQVNEEKIKELLGIPISYMRIKCANLSLKTLKKITGE
ncbi:MAG: SUF system NifU family Fe-S cluster assembly protein [Candidatus Nanoarchaeia archaeon]|nr:SUF system NifU family Fe-S cluster assembly protein [Candidatus Nanoarchaeia archaeon]